MKKGVVAAVSAAVTFIYAFIAFAPTASRDVNDFRGAEAVVSTAAETSGSIEFKKEGEAAETKKGVFARLGQWIWRAVKSLAVSAAAAVATLTLKLGGSLVGNMFAGAAGKVAGFILGEFLPVFFATSLMFCLLFRLLFPEIELKAFLKPKTILVLVLGSLAEAFAAHLTAAKIENGVVGCFVCGLLSAAVIAAMWYLCFRSGVETPSGRVKILGTWRAALLLAVMLAASALMGLLKSSLVGSGISVLAAGSYVNCGLYCVLLSLAAAYIYNRVTKLRKKSSAAA